MARSSHELEQLRGFVLSVLDFTKTPVSTWALKPLQDSKSVKGFRDAARDMVEICDDLPPVEVERLDRFLAREGFPTLTQMRDSRYRQFLKVLSRGTIKSNDEFRLLSSFVADTDSPYLSAATRSVANRVLAEFELKGESGAS